jgi:diguanylate cyclase (GGDEF)-like protein
MLTAGETPRERRPATVAALLVVAVVAIFQTVVIFLLIGAQQDSAHIIDVSGLQRMRSQQLAYLALSMSASRPERGAAADIESTIAEMLATRAEIMREPRYDTGPRDEFGRTALTRLADAYFADVRAVERHPSDPSAIAVVRRMRPIVVAAYDAAVKFRVGVARVRHDALIGALFFGLTLQIASIAGVWFAIVAPSEGRARRLDALNAEQMQRLSDLYGIASANGRTAEESLDSAIALLAARLGYDYGVVTEISNELVTVVSTCGNPAGVAVGNVRPLKASLAQLAIAAPEVYEVRDVSASPGETSELRALGWKSVAGMKIVIGGVLYGTIGFASDRKRAAALSQADIGFMRLACALLATIIERGRQLRRLDSLAFSDPLTGLPNRVQFAQRLDDLVGIGKPFAVHYVDLDRFKSINDSLGHAAGDTVLTIASARLQHCVRKNDLVARLGGDEFAIVQVGPVDRERATSLAKRVVDSFSAPVDIGGNRRNVGASIGVALYPEHGSDADAVVAAADAALYRAKHGGRGRLAYATDDQQISA